MGSHLGGVLSLSLLPARAVKACLGSRERAAYLGAAGAEPARLLRRLIGLNRRGWRQTGLDSNHDLWPRDEFNAP